MTQARVAPTAFQTYELRAAISTDKRGHGHRGAYSCKEHGALDSLIPWCAYPLKAPACHDATEARDGGPSGSLLTL
jgi:hypothetical protein